MMSKLNYLTKVIKNIGFVLCFLFCFFGEAMADPSGPYVDELEDKGLGDMFKVGEWNSVLDVVRKIFVEEGDEGIEDDLVGVGTFLDPVGEICPEGTYHLDIDGSGDVIDNGECFSGLTIDLDDMDMGAHNLLTTGEVDGVDVSDLEISVLANKSNIILNSAVVESLTTSVAANDTDKADKVDSAVNGNLAGLDDSGNLIDSGISVDGGNVGVGTASPEVKLDIKGAVDQELAGTVTVAAGTKILTGVGTAFTTTLKEGDIVDIYGQVMVIDSVTDDTNAVLIENHILGATNVVMKLASGLMQLTDATGEGRISIDANGNVGIGDTDLDGTLMLDVEGQVGATEYCDENGDNCANILALSAEGVPYTGATGDMDLGVYNLLTTGEVDGVDVSDLSVIATANTENVDTNAVNIMDIYSQLDGNLETIEGISAQGVLQANVTGDVFGSMSLADGVSAITQTTGDNSTKVATTEYVDGALTVVTGDTIIEGNTTVETIDAGTDGIIVFETEGEEAMRIDEVGNVGIGTNNPTQALDVNGISQAEAHISVGGGTHPTGIGAYVETYVYAENTGRLFAYDGASYKDLAIGDWNSGDADIMLKAGGNVGMGTDAPEGKLHVLESDAANLPLFERKDSSSDSLLGVVNFLATTSATMQDGFGPTLSMNIKGAPGTVNEVATLGAQRDGADNSGALSFYTSNAGILGETMVMKANGNVGIGDSSPEAKLHLVADADETLGVGITVCSAGYTWTVDENQDGILNAGDKCSKGALMVEGNILPEMTGATEDVASSGDFYVSNRTLGGPDNWFKALYVQDLHLGQNTLYMNGEPVLSNDSAQLEFSATSGQDMIVSTEGTNGELSLNSESTISTNVASTNSGKNINLTNSSANGNILVSADGANGDVTLSAYDEISLSADDDISLIAVDEISFTAPIVEVNGTLKMPTVTLPEQVVDPGILDKNGRLYTKDDEGTTKLYFRNDVGVVTDLLRDPSSLAVDPADCVAGTYATAIDSSGNLSCATPVDLDTQLDEAAVDGFVANNGYLTSYIETDSIFTAWDKSTGISVATSQISDWATATSGFLTSYIESDPLFTVWDKSTGISITESQVTDLQAYLLVESDPKVGTLTDTKWCTSDGSQVNCNSESPSVAAASGVAGAVQFSDGSGGFSATDTDLVWDNTNKRLGIGTNAPTESLEVTGKLKIVDELIETETVTFDGSSAAGLKMSNADGYITMTPLNSGWAHIYTDRDQFIFNKEVYVVGGIFSSYSDSDLTLSAGGVRGDLTIDNATGDVGIGTNAPTKSLEVKLDDAAGEDEFKITDSAGVHAFSVDSDGNVLFGAYPANVNFNNANVTGMNNVAIADTGASEGMTWAGTSFSVDVSDEERVNGSTTNLNLYGTSGSIVGWRPLKLKGTASALTVEGTGTSTFAGPVNATAFVGDGSGLTNVLAGNRYKANIADVSDAGWTRVAHINGANYGANIELTLGGTTTSTVVEMSANILVQHSADIYVESYSGEYTQVTLRISSDGNDEFDIEVKTDSSNLVTLAASIVAKGDETVTMNPVDAFTGTTVHTHATEATRKVITGTGTNYGIKTAGSITAGSFVGEGSGLTNLVEVDPKVGTLTDTKWCRSDGSQVICDVNSFTNTDSGGDITGVTAGAGLSGGGSSGELTLNVDYLPAADDRDVQPIDLPESSRGIRGYFVSLEGLTTGTADGNYQDLLVMDTYSDSSGGKVNALAFDKSTKEIRHYLGDYGGTDWGTPEILANQSWAQKRVATSCASGQSIRAIAVDGTVTCEVDTDTNTQLTESQVDAYANNNGYYSASGGTITGAVTMTPTADSAQLADTFAADTRKSYILFSAATGSSDSGAIMHETSTTETNEGVLHLLPSDDNSYGDYVSIHGSNDPDVLKLHTDGTVEGVKTLSASGTITAPTFSGNATTATTAANANLLDNYNTSSSATASTVAVRDSAADITARLFRSEYNLSNPTIGYIMTQVNIGTGTDNYVRPSTPAQFRSAVTDDYYVADPGCGSGEQLTYNGTSWTCVSPAVGDITGVTAGTGLTGGGTTGALTLNVVGGTGITAAADAISITNDSVGDTQLAFNTGQHLTTTSSPTFDNLYVGGTTDAASRVVRVTSADGYNAGFEAYGASQGTGYLYVGQSVTHGGGISYNGDGAPEFASGETMDNITFFRRTGGVNSEVFHYAHNSDTVNFNGAINTLSVNTGQGANELYAMNQAVRTTDSPSFAGLSVGGTLNAEEIVTGRQGVVNVYDSTKLAGVWSMGESYVVPATGADLGTLYGMAYAHTNAGTTVNEAYPGFNHQILFASAGIRHAAISLTSGAAWFEGEVTAAGYYYNSDERLKESISTIENPLDVVAGLRGVDFNWKSDGSKSIGFIAQEVEEVLPELVHEGDQGLKSVEYGNITAVLVEAVKAQQKQIEEQEKIIEKQQLEHDVDITELKAQIVELVNRLDNEK